MKKHFSVRHIVIIFLALLFTFVSFGVSIYEIATKQQIPKDRYFTLEHNYMFDFNFYLSRIKEGQEGRWQVSEKYFNLPHPPSLFQVMYLYLGKIGGLAKLSPTVIYHGTRLLFGFLLLYLSGRLVMKLIDGKWQLVTYLFIVTAGSWPVLVWLKPVENNIFTLLGMSQEPRFGIHMGWWSAIDSFQRITFLPHVLLGQIFILVFIRVFGWKDYWDRSLRKLRYLKMGIWGFAGLIIGIIFPPTLIVIYVYLSLITVAEFGELLWKERINGLTSEKILFWLNTYVIQRVIFIILSVPSFLYVSYMFKFPPWSELPLFDIRHRTNIPYDEYRMALGPVLHLSIIGMVVALIRREKKLIPIGIWLLSVGALLKIFERVPQQSPLRFTEAALNIPMGILSGYLFWSLSVFINKLKNPFRLISNILLRGLAVAVIVLGLSVMTSMYLWKRGETAGKKSGGWLVPIGIQLAYPLKDFMDGVFFLRDNTNTSKVVLAYVTASNYIPAYAGNYVYIGHANTPDEVEKNKIVANFFSGKMTKDAMNSFIRKENISYIYYGPQEKEWNGGKKMEDIYPDLKKIYENKMVEIYKVI